MITREILETQLTLYQEGREKAIAAHARAEDALEKAKADLGMFAGAIDSCQNFLRILTQLEEAQEAKEPRKKD